MAKWNHGISRTLNSIYRLICMPATFTLSRRTFLLAIFSFWETVIARQILSGKSQRHGNQLNPNNQEKILDIANKNSVYKLKPEDFGAIGNGLTRDGDALNSMINHINKVPGEIPILVEMSRTYNIVGSNNSIPDVHGESVSTIAGLLPITKDYVCVDGLNSGQLVVEKEFPFTKTTRGKNSSDSFVHGIHLQGDNCTVKNLSIFGRIDERQVSRGTTPYGFGGQEFGLILSGSNNKVYNCNIQGWGTDCIFISGDKNAVAKCNISHARRNCVSVVPYYVPKSITNNLLVYTSSLTDCVISNGGYGSLETWNRPGTGIQVEAAPRSEKLKACVLINQCNFHTNRKSDCQLSKNSINCIINSSQFSGPVNLRPLQLGGHNIENNKFMGSKSIVVSRNRKNTTSIRVCFNKYMSSNIIQRRGFKFDLFPHVQPQIFLESSNERI